MFKELNDRIHNLLVRAKLTGTDDSGPRQKVKGIGQHGELYGGQTLIIRLQQAGFSAVASKGDFLTLNLHGNPDQALAIGLENGDARPKNLNPGDAVMYNERAPQDTFKIGQDGTATLTCKRLVIVVEEDVTISAGTEVIVDAPAVHLGGAGGLPVALLGSTDSGGEHITGNVSSKVFAVL